MRSLSRELGKKSLTRSSDQKVVRERRKKITQKVEVSSPSEIGGLTLRPAALIVTPLMKRMMSDF